MNFKFGRIIFVILSALCLTLGNAWADVPTPRIKPPPPKLSSLLDSNDARNFKSALSASDRRRWSTFKSYRDKVKDPIAKDILYWLQATRDSNMSFSDLSYVINNLTDWPRMSTIQAKAEYKLFERPQSGANTISWFAGRDPVSGEGRIVLADAYYSLGDTTNGDRWLKHGWREAKLTRTRQKTVYRKHKDRLTPEDHAARADYLVWEGSSHFSKVQGLLSLMPKGDRAATDARMRLLRNSSGIQTAIRRIPSSHSNDPGFLYARGKWRRQKRSKDYALETFHNIIEPAATEKGKERLWRERKIMAYWAIEEGKYSDAYRLTRNHGMSRGAAFAEAEFLGGWLALTKALKPKHIMQMQRDFRIPITGFWRAKNFHRADRKSLYRQSPCCHWNYQTYPMTAGSKL